MLRWYVLRSFVRYLIFLAGAAFCAGFAYAFATSPVAGFIVPLVVTIFGLMSTIALVGGGIWAFRRPPSWKRFNRADFRAQRRIIRAAGRACRAYPQSISIPTGTGWDLGITYPNRREWPGELSWFIRYGTNSYLRISILCSPESSLNPAEPRRSYGLYPLSGPSVTIGDGSPAKPTDYDYDWLLDKLRAARRTSGR